MNHLDAAVETSTDSMTTSHLDAKIMFATTHGKTIANEESRSHGMTTTRATMSLAHEQVIAAQETGTEMTIADIELRQLLSVGLEMTTTEVIAVTAAMPNGTGIGIGSATMGEIETAMAQEIEIGSGIATETREGPEVAEIHGIEIVDRGDHPGATTAQI